MNGVEGISSADMTGVKKKISFIYEPSVAMLLISPTSAKPCRCYLCEAYWETRKKVQHCKSYKLHTTLHQPLILSSASVADKI
jgi:hypothetical protein